MEERKEITRKDVEWVVHSGHYAARPEQLADRSSRVGCIHGLAVFGSHQGSVMEIEAAAREGTGRITVTGIVEEEEMGQEGHRMRRKSTAKGSAENVMTLLGQMGYPVKERDIHINYPGGAPVDGPSAGVAMALVVISAITGRPVDGTMAVTGEISVRGRVKPVGGVPSKVDAAQRAGLNRVLVPRENDLEQFGDCAIEVTPIDTLEEAIELMLLPLGAMTQNDSQAARMLPLETAAAQGHEPAVSRASGEA